MVTFPTFHLFLSTHREFIKLIPASEQPHMLFYARNVPSHLQFFFTPAMNVTSPWRPSLTSPSRAPLLFTNNFPVTPITLCQYCGLLCLLRPLWGQLHQSYARSALLATIYSVPGTCKHPHLFPTLSASQARLGHTRPGSFPLHSAWYAGEGECLLKKQTHAQKTIPELHTERMRCPRRRFITVIQEGKPILMWMTGFIYLLLQKSDCFGWLTTNLKGLLIKINWLVHGIAQKLLTSQVWSREANSQFWASVGMCVSWSGWTVCSLGPAYLKVTASLREESIHTSGCLHRKPPPPRPAPPCLSTHLSTLLCVPLCTFYHFKPLYLCTNWSFFFFSLCPALHPALPHPRLLPHYYLCS